MKHRGAGPRPHESGHPDTTSEQRGKHERKRYDEQKDVETAGAVRDEEFRIRADGIEQRLHYGDRPQAAKVQPHGGLQSGSTVNHFARCHPPGQWVGSVRAWDKTRGPARQLMETKAP